MDFQVWQIFRYIVETNALLILLGCLLNTVLFFSRFSWFKVSYCHLLKGSYILLTLALLIPIANIEKNADSFIKPLVTEYGGVKYADFKTYPAGRKTLKVFEVMAGPSREGMLRFVSDFDYFIFALSILGALVFLVQLIRSKLQIKDLDGKSFLLKKHLKIEIKSSDNVAGPFSILYRGRRLVFVPNQMLCDKVNLDLAIKHELQHHRQGDTRFAYVLEFLKGFFFYNPFAWLLNRQMIILQELACDESLVGRQDISSRAYGHCLLKVAEYQSKCDQGMVFDSLVGTASLSASAKFLKRRILAMSTKKPLSKTKTTILALTTFTLFSTISYGAKSLTKSNRISMSRAQELVKAANERSSIPVYVDREVLKYLNMGLGTERGRRYLKTTLRRMNKYKDMIQSHLHSYNLPEELLAVPAHESGYQDYDNGIGAGIWSFTPSTARHYGLKVDDHVDQRRNPKKLTVAAMKYYSHLIGIKEFKGNWHLATMAYNSGERRLISAMKEVGSSDIREIIKRSKKLKKENLAYIPRLMAWIIILKNPELL